MNKLQAINTILDELGTHHVTSVDSRHPDAKTAVLQLATETDALLTRGYWFNTLVGVTLPVQPNGYLNVGAKVLASIPTDPALRSRYVQRNRYIWDLENNTRKFTESLEVNQFVSLDFEDLPQNAQMAIVSAAAAVVVRAKLSDNIKADGLHQRGAAFESMLLDDELRITTPNAFESRRIAYKRNKMLRRQ